MTEKTNRDKLATFVLVVIIILICALVLRHSFVSRMRPFSVTPGPARSVYNPHVICDDAFKADVHHEDDNIHHFPVVMREGCFSGFIYVPKTWKAFHTQPVGDQTGFWSAFWFANQPEPAGPYPPNSNVVFNYPSRVFRLQGHGTILFYENVPDEEKPHD